MSFKSTFSAEKPKKLDKTSFNVKFLIGIICILLHRPKRLTLVGTIKQYIKTPKYTLIDFHGLHAYSNSH